MVPLKTTAWDLTPLFSSDNDPEMNKKRKKIKSVNSAFVAKWKNRDDYLQDPRILKRALDEYELLQRSYGTEGDEGYYFFLRSQLN